MYRIDSDWLIKIFARFHWLRLPLFAITYFLIVSNLKGRQAVKGVSLLLANKKRFGLNFFFVGISISLRISLIFFMNYGQDSQFLKRV